MQKNQLLAQGQVKESQIETWSQFTDFPSPVVQVCIYIYVHIYMVFIFESFITVE